ncbi:hypothetical protein AAG906_022047 [Vitis piasezkii]
MGFFFLSIPRLLDSITSHSRYHLLSSELPRESHRFATVHSPKIRHHMVEGPRFLHCKPRPLCSGTDPPFHLFENDQNSINLDGLPSPRIFATHAPYSLLPHSVKDSNCRIVYICRNPLDQFISHWHFVDSIGTQSPGDVKATSYEDALEMFCEGVNAFGPIWDHVLGTGRRARRDLIKCCF